MSTRSRKSLVVHPGAINFPGVLWGGVFQHPQTGEHSDSHPIVRINILPEFAGYAKGSNHRWRDSKSITMYRKLPFNKKLVK